MKRKRVAIYARVSTGDQTTENQLLELRACAERMRWNIVGEYVDHAISGAKGRDKRPALDKLMHGVTRREFDMVAAFSIDRLGRSMRHLLDLLEELQAKEIDLYLHQQGIDTSTPAGTAFFQMFGVFSQFERAMIQERVKAGLSRAKAQGKTLGRPTVDQRVERQVLKLRDEGNGILKIAAALGIGSSTVQRIVKANRPPPG